MNDVTVLMSTYNGSKYLRTQIDSILKQIDVNVNLLIRDDGSNDSTLDILKEYASKYQNINFYTGKNLGPAHSFIDLMNKAPKSTYYAFSDQDDYWLPDKLKRSIDEINKYDVTGRPALYYGCPRLVDEKLDPLNQRMNITYIDSFQEAMISSQAPGCTMLFNYELLEKVVQNPKIRFLHMHDDWLHKVCLIYRGYLCFDEDVHILYRQHSSNVVGGKSSFVSSVLQHIASFQTRKCVRSRTIVSLFECYKNDMDPQIYELCKEVCNYQKNCFSRLKVACSINIHSRSFKKELACRSAIFLGMY